MIGPGTTGTVIMPGCPGRGTTVGISTIGNVTAGSVITLGQVGYECSGPGG